MREAIYKIVLQIHVEMSFHQRFGQRGLAQEHPSHTIDSGLFSAPPFSYAPL